MNREDRHVRRRVPTNAFASCGRLLATRIFWLPNRGTKAAEAADSAIGNAVLLEKRVHHAVAPVLRTVSLRTRRARDQAGYGPESDRVYRQVALLVWVGGV